MATHFATAGFPALLTASSTAHPAVSPLEGAFLRLMVSHCEVAVFQTLAVDRVAKVGHLATMGLLKLVVSHCEAAGFQTLAVHRVAKAGLLTLLADYRATAEFPTLTVGLPTFEPGHCVTAGFPTLAADRLATMGFLRLVADHLVMAGFPMLLADHCLSVANDTATRHPNFPASQTQVSRP